ncbi:hypothetical protein H3N56_01030 [Cetobacterium sp. 2A]|uniref:hypothetical protein n=1 Tax=unclassified Cetobacterium TaxID=2630983 RepID=UPI00163D0524|nr:hypothetical protein [Cetobacterium sp. 2A]MBC2855076.1 hypothetical protein [Cetobacterium sp. 2A]
MAKKLITLDNINEYLCGEEFYVSKDMILPPNIKDYLKEKNVKVIYNNDSELIVKILKEEYKIIDDRKINEILRKVKDVIKDGN